MKLERIEDFERKIQALRNPDANPYEYIVQPYGYCPGERKITPYRGEYGPEGVFIWCLSCRTLFSDAAQSSSETSYYSGDLAPQRFAAEIARLHSRYQQSFELEKAAIQKTKELRARRAKLLSEVEDLEDGIVRLVSVELGAAGFEN